MGQGRSYGDTMVGRRLGAYLVEDLLGEGAMGSVYVATDLNLGREVALKVIHRSLLVDGLYCERFLREARAAARLNHPNIVQVYFAGTDDGIPYLALELVRGGSVAGYLRRAGGKLPPRRACELVRDAARALGAAHEQGIVHRDIKPDNMLLGGQGQVKLTDFGIARVAAVSNRLTQSGFFVGTPRYSSPEQCRSEENIDGRSDLYSLGVCFYEMLTGDVPFDAKTPLALLQKICTEPPRPVREVAPDVPGEVAAIVALLLEKAPDARHPGAGALVADLEGAIAALPDVPVTLAEVAPPPEAGMSSRGRRRDSSSTDAARRAFFGGGGSGSGGRGVAASPPLGTPPSGNAPTLKNTPIPFSTRREAEGAVAGEAEFTDGTTPIALHRPGSGTGRTPAFDRASARLEMIERLADGGKPIAALRAAATLAKEILDDPKTARYLFEKAPRDAQGRDPFYAAVAKIVAILRDRGTRFRPVPSVVDAVDAIARLHVSLAMLAGDLSDLVEARRAATAGSSDAPGAPRLHVEAIVHLAELGVGLPLSWKWDELAGAYDDAIVPLDPDGRQQVQAAATVFAGLVSPDEQRKLKEFNERRRIVPVVSLRNVGSILGTSAGLPTFLAMVAARFGLTPRGGVAATGAFDGASVPPLPPADRFSASVYDRFLAVEIARVEAIREKVQAVLEQCPDVQTIVLPAQNRAEVEGDAALLKDLEAAKIRLVFVSRVEDVLRADLFMPPLEVKPLRVRPSEPMRPTVRLDDEDAEALEPEGAHAAVHLARLGAGAAAAFAALAALAAGGAI